MKTLENIMDELKQTKDVNNNAEVFSPWSFDKGAEEMAKIKDAQIEGLVEALSGILEIGKRDMSNPKYDGYFETATKALENFRKGAKSE